MPRAIGISSRKMSGKLLTSLSSPPSALCLGLRCSKTVGNAQGWASKRLPYKAP